MDIYVLTVYAVLTLPTGTLTAQAHVEVMPASSVAVCHQYARQVVIPKVRERNGGAYSYQHVCVKYTPLKEVV